MENDNSIITEENIGRLRALLENAEQGNVAETEQLLDEFARQREQVLFNEIGKLTREFHDALNSFRLDARIANLAEKDIPDARERLHHVVTMTAQSADKSLTAAEESMPLCDSIHNQAVELNSEWERFSNREMSAGEFRGLSSRIAEFFQRVASDTETLRGNLNEVIMAQDFQDLTGQIITRVITLVDEMENSLIDLVRISGQKLTQPGEEKKEEQKLAGPVVPGVETEGTVSGQDEVDDLLSSLGF
jgi:chemotaxis protein CheZ